MRRLLAMFLVLLPALRAQFDTATILGNVRDKTGGVITRAKVTLTNLDTGIELRRRRAELRE